MASGLVIIVDNSDGAKPSSGEHISAGGSAVTVTVGGGLVGELVWVAVIDGTAVLGAVVGAMDVATGEVLLKVVQPVRPTDSNRENTTLR